MNERKNPHLRALAAITWYLAKRDHSEKELREKMRERHTPEAIQSALDEARERGWLARPEDLAQRVADALSRRQKSAGYIQGYLRKKGLPQAQLDDQTELEKAQHLLQTKLRKTANLTHEERVKAFRWLKSRGFGDKIIRRAIYEKSNEES